MDGILVGTDRNLEERLRAQRQLAFGSCRRIHVSGVELGNALCFVGGGDIDRVYDRRACATSRREGLVCGRVVARRIVGDGVSLANKRAHEFEVGGGLNHR